MLKARIAFAKVLSLRRSSSEMRVELEEIAACVAVSEVMGLLSFGECGGQR
jgi:hypothetical protein